MEKKNIKIAVDLILTNKHFKIKMEKKNIKNSCWLNIDE